MKKRNKSSSTSTSSLSTPQKSLTPHEPLQFALAEWFLRQNGRALGVAAIAQAIAELTKREVRERDLGRWITLTRFRLETAHSATIVYDRLSYAYRVAPKGSYAASRFTMGHYRRAVLSAARARELDQLGFLSPEHIDQVVEEVMQKTSRKTRELAGIKEALISSWKALRTKERKALSHGKAHEKDSVKASV